MTRQPAAAAGGRTRDDCGGGDEICAINCPTLTCPAGDDRSLRDSCATWSARRVVERVLTPNAKLSELCLLFLRLGLTAFGGPAAHIAIMESEVVRRRRWLSSERFLDLLGASNLIPGLGSLGLASL